MIMFFLCTGEASCTDKTEKLSLVFLALKNHDQIV